jgi:hypothetical protein
MVSVSLNSQLMHCRVNDGRRDLLPQASRTVAVVLAIVQVLEVVVLELLFQRKIIKLPSESKLSVNLFLTDAKVLHIEETDMLCSVSELFGQLLLAVWSIEEAQIESYKLSPVHLMIKLEFEPSSCISYGPTVCFGLWHLFVRGKDSAGHDCGLLMEVVWSDALQGVDGSKENRIL